MAYLSNRLWLCLANGCSSACWNLSLLIFCALFDFTALKEALWGELSFWFFYGMLIERGRQFLDKDVIQTGWLTPCFKSLAKFLFLLWFQESQNLVPLPSPVRHLRPRRPRSLYWKVFKEHRKGRFAQMSTSTVPKPFACKELPNTQGTLLQGLTNLITLPSSSILWPQSRPWRRSKTTTHLCSLSMWELTSPRSRHQWKSCTTLRLPKSTLWSGTC